MENTYSARELYDELKIKTKYNDWIKRVTSYGFIKGEDFNIIETVKTTSNPKNPYSKIKDHIVSEEMKNWITAKYGSKDVIPRKEISFLNLLEEQLEAIGITDSMRQYYVLNKYKIDLYIPSLNIAIEYDEYEHNGYSYEKQEGRQKKIEEELGCKFIRVSDDKTHVANSAIVLKKILTI